MAYLLGELAILLAHPPEGLRRILLGVRAAMELALSVGLMVRRG